MRTKILVIMAIVLVSISTKSLAQELSVIKKAGVSIDELPEYVVITSENTKLLGGINIIIDYKRSTYKKYLQNLENLLQGGDKLRVRNQTDLLNSMAQLGYEYIDAYNATGGTLGASGGNDVDVFGSNTKFRINMVFRKKEKFRQ